MNVENRVRELVEEKIADREDLFIVSITMHSNGKLIILLDGDKGVEIADCVAVSRHVGYHLEEENVIETAYNLEVSSPGIDTPLSDARQYRKNVGRSLGLKGEDGNTREGTLLAVTEEGVSIEEKVKEKGKKAVLVESFVPFNDIKEAKVLISFK